MNVFFDLFDDGWTEYIKQYLFFSASGRKSTYSTEKMFQ